MFSRVIPWIAALGETVVVLAQHNPSSSTAARILELLVRRERASAIPIGLTAPFIFGTLLAISGGLLRSWCYNTLGRFFTFQMGIRRDHRLITKGPYSFVRHPSYTGAMLCSSGVWISLLSRGSWLRESGVAEYLVVQLVIALNILLLGLICGGMVLRISAEDAMLRKEFGKEWDEWAQRVPYRLFTGIY
ncbi:hypothetical protein JAAARDRAFT_62646 [Jaapia argillacea MUCL 33604]|uniref:Protein-S-isoprenylcysteine O-methyltransferase n=1 Tax=Jaapia argillacea MUCL 33604 TaxID=933084 RepID=A0A067P8K3_9AGAM|nr:hypothetical protein JAAARDRAFT_62646 [Jaapia argillacea MUCL 33604]